MAVCSDLNWVTFGLSNEYFAYYAIFVINRNLWIENRSPEYFKSMILGLGEPIVVQSCDWLRSDQ
ncbi:unnamed protein product [Prunus armeniaca]